MKMSLFQERIHKSLLLACFLFACASSSKLDCCEPGIDWVEDSLFCKDNRTIKLDCPDGSYVVNPKDDVEGFYRTNESNWLISVDNGSHALDAHAPDIFCQASLKNELRYVICFPEQSTESVNVQTWYLVFFGLCSVLSGIFLAVTLLVYLILPELRDLQDKAIMSLCASFMFAFFIIGVPKISNFTTQLDDTTCVILAFLMYYSFLSAFFWLNVISLNICRSVWLRRFKATDGVLFAIYCALGWGVPLCFLIFTAVAHYSDTALIKPGFGQVSCWFDGYSATWLYFYSPILILLLLNLLYLALTSWKLWHKYETFDCNQANVLKAKCTMFLKLSILMGATWIFEIISFAFRGTNQLVWILPDFLNASQGLIIFIFFVIARTRVRKLLAERRPCKIPFPRSWAAYKDHEKSQQNCIDEFRLAHA